MNVISLFPFVRGFACNLSNIFIFYEVCSITRTLCAYHDTKQVKRCIGRCYLNVTLQIKHCDLCTKRTVLMCEVQAGNNASKTQMWRDELSVEQSKIRRKVKQ
jgi:hypothetical protein